MNKVTYTIHCMWKLIQLPGVLFVHAIGFCADMLGFTGVADWCETALEQAATSNTQHPTPSIQWAAVLGWLLNFAALALCVGAWLLLYLVA